MILSIFAFTFYLISQRIASFFSRSSDFVIKNNDTQGDIILGVSGKDKTIIITPQGNVGIGTTDPKGVFDIRGGNLVIPESESKVGIGITNPQYQLDIKRLKDLGTYRGSRHRKRLPVRGQRTHSNARTRKGKAIAIAGKKLTSMK